MTASALVYIDSSVLLTLVLEQDGHEAVARLIADAARAGRALAASRVLWLEGRRVAVREALAGNPIASAVERHLSTITQLPVTEQVWERAAGIEQHIKTLDAIHLATCELAEATLATVGLDGAMRKIAEIRGIPVLAA